MDILPYSTIIAPDLASISLIQIRLNYKTASQRAFSMRLFFRLNFLQTHYYFNNVE